VRITSGDRWATLWAQTRIGSVNDYALAAQVNDGGFVAMAEISQAAFSRIQLVHVRWPDRPA
jgi:hypothetical protein